ncbi:protein of unknown function [Cyclobacterium lianum]|uniref:DUF4252 domain-containing protein n=1 Tax=Cyclobacterium lianum TaxID=388280 RepID=A0A1M7KI87_9BACT|nr:DUF4252 domain-containing protein [Cyclobacterium lianum]SHM64589.1 protein of unknown function [Cyclobacterium lianum]
MKKILLLIVLLVPVLVQAQEDAIERFYSKYMDDERFSRVFISPKMMQMAGGFLNANSPEGDEDAEELFSLISKVRGIRILSGEQVTGLSMFDEAIGLLNRNQYEELMDIRDKGSSLKFMVREERGRIKELLMISGATNEFTLMSMLGDFTYQDLNMLSEKTNLPGMKEYGQAKKE